MAGTVAVSDGGIFSADYRASPRRFCACKISLLFTFHSSADLLLADSLMSHPCKGWTSPERSEPFLVRMSSPPCQALPFGGTGITRSKSVSPVHVNVLPSTGLSRDFASDGLAIQQSSTVARSGQGVPENNGFVVRRTSICLISNGGGSSGQSSGLHRVARGMGCRHIR